MDDPPWTSESRCARKNLFGIPESVLSFSGHGVFCSADGLFRTLNHRFNCWGIGGTGAWWFHRAQRPADRQAGRDVERVADQANDRSANRVAESRSVAAEWRSRRTDFTSRSETPSGFRSEGNCRTDRKAGREAACRMVNTGRNRWLERTSSATQSGRHCWVDESCRSRLVEVAVP